MLTERLRPVLRYPGSKWMIAPWILDHVPPHHVYCEPYGGSGCVLLAKPRSKVECWNDLNDDLWNVFYVLRDPDMASSLRSAAELTPYSRTEFRKVWEPFPDGLDPVERARRTLVRSWLGFTGRITSPRNDPSKEMRLPSGRHRKIIPWPKWPGYVDAFTERLQGVFLENDPALVVIKRWERPNTVFYVDPPYEPSTRRDDLYGDQEMTAADHEELAATLHGLAEAAVVLSGYRSDLYDTLYAAWRRVERRSRSLRGKHTTECLWLNDMTVAGLEGDPQRRLEMAL